MTRATGEAAVRVAVRVMVVEDDDDLRLAVTTELAAGGLTVDQAGDLAGAGSQLDAGTYHCVVFDRMLPDGDAIDYVQRRRHAGWTVPVLFLTARDSTADIVAGFQHGGDDYLVKPFALAEVSARVRLLAGRAGSGRPAVLRHADLELDSARQRVRRAGVLVILTNKEFAVLEFLMSRAGQAVTRTEVIEHCWDDRTDPMSNVVDAVIKRVRAKLGEPPLLHTVRGFGYRIGDQA